MEAAIVTLWSVLNNIQQPDQMSELSILFLVNTRTIATVLALVGGGLSPSMGQIPAAQSELQQFLSERSAFAQDLRRIQERSRGESREVRLKRLQQWRQVNASRLEALRQRASQLSATNPRSELPIINEIEIPENATAEMEEFLVERAQLQNERTKLLNKLGTSSPDAVRQALASWRVQTEPQRESLQNRAARVSAEGTANLTVTEPPSHPDVGDSLIQSFLAERHKLMKERMLEENRIRKLPPEEKDASRRAWIQQSAGRLEALRRQAKELEN